MRDGFDSETPTHVDRLPPRVLIVDDDVAIRNALMRLLSHWGYIVGTASSVAEALDLAVSWRPRVLVLDVHLCGEDGLELLDRMRDALGDDGPAVLVCTGTAGTAPPGAAGLITKPFDVRGLVQRVHDLVRGREQTLH